VPDKQLPACLIWSPVIIASSDICSAHSLGRASHPAHPAGVFHATVRHDPSTPRIVPIPVVVALCIAFAALLWTAGGAVFERPAFDNAEHSDD
jgi:hypothetical protein